MKNKNSIIELPEFINKLKKEEIRNKSNLKIAIGMYWTAIVIYIGILFLPNPDLFSLDKIGTFICLIGFILILVFIQRAKNNYKQIDYSTTTYAMLKEVVRRYKSFLSYKITRINPAAIIIGLVLVEIGLTMKMYIRFDSIEPLFRILYIQIAWFLLISFGLGIGILLWYKRYKPLRDNALLMIKEIEGE